MSYNLSEDPNDRELLLRENEALRRQVATLQDEVERSRTTLYSIGDAVIATDAEGNVLQMNPVAETLTGWSEIDAKGRPTAQVFKVVNEETRREVESPVARVLREGVVVGLANHSLLIAKDGVERPIADSGAPIRGEKGEFLGAVLVFRDQTTERRAENEVRQAEERFRTFFDNAPIGKSVTAPDGKLLRVNAAFGAMLGYSVEELQTISFASITHPDDLAESRECIRALLAGERDVWTMEKRYLAKDGRHVWTRVTTRLQRGEVQSPLYFLTHIEDITEIKRASVALRESEQRLRRLYESGLLGVIFWNMRGQIVDANDKFLQMAGYSRDDVATGQIDWVNMTPPEYRYLDEASVAELKATGVNKTPFDKEYVRKDGTRIPITIAGAMLDEERVDGVAFVLDITERKRMEEKIRRNRDELEQRVRDRTAELEESNKELEAFSYSVSHDLRAPLRAIDGFTRLLATRYEPQLDAEGQRLCSVIRENTRKMGRLIDDLLAFSRLGRAAMLPSVIDMGTMANSVFYELTTPESRERIDFEVRSLPTAIGDLSLMRQVWTNLLGNAVKFSSKRERSIIKVSGEIREGENVYAVQDNGAGFDMQYVGKLFGVFQRLHSTKEFEGTGVGLALVQRVIRRHGGRVWAEGKIDQGAKFYFALTQKGASPCTRHML